MPPMGRPAVLLAAAAAAAVVAPSAAKLQPGDLFAVPALAGGCAGTAEFIGCFRDDMWDGNNCELS